MLRTTARVAALLAVAVAATLAIGAGSASAATLLVTDTGAGSVIETTSAQNMYCQTPADQSNQEYTDCEENYGLGWIVELHAVPAAGYDFDGWQGKARLGRAADPARHAADRHAQTDRDHVRQAGHDRCAERVRRLDDRAWGGDLVSPPHGPADYDGRGS